MKHAKVVNGSTLHPSFVEQQDYAVVAEFLENMVSLFMFIQIKTEVKPDYRLKNSLTDALET